MYFTNLIPISLPRVEKREIYFLWRLTMLGAIFHVVMSTKAVRTSTFIVCLPSFVTINVFVRSGITEATGLVGTIFNKMWRFTTEITTTTRFLWRSGKVFLWTVKNQYKYSECKYLDENHTESQTHLLVFDKMQQYLCQEQY